MCGSRDVWGRRECVEEEGVWGEGCGEECVGEEGKHV